MPKPRIFIDGSAGTTGLQITERLEGRDDIELMRIDYEKRRDDQTRIKFLNDADLVFFCLPDDEAKRANTLITNEKTRVIDASTAHRTCDNFVYGLPEIEGQRELIRSAMRVSNPGCHATGAICLLHPLIKNGLLSPKTPIFITSVTGYTGGGKSMIAEYEKNDRHWELNSPRAYSLGMTHKHLPEIKKYAGLAKNPAFMPIVADYPQGMQVLIPIFAENLCCKNNENFVNTHNGCGDSLYSFSRVVFDTLKAHFAGCKNVDVWDESPQFSASNVNADTDKLTLRVLGSEEILLLTAQFNNLGKGAAGAAIQNMNLMLGFDEYSGIIC